MKQSELIENLKEVGYHDSDPITTATTIIETVIEMMEKESPDAYNEINWLKQSLDTLYAIEE